MCILPLENKLATRDLSMGTKFRINGNKPAISSKSKINVATINITLAVLFLKNKPKHAIS